MARPTRPILILLLGITAALMGNGCDSTNRVVPEGIWPWAPVEVQFHGLSRFIDREGEERLSLRIEFLDVDGDPVKFPGTVIFEVDPETSIDETWTFEFDLEDLKENARHWDRVTSMYRFELDVGWEDPPLPVVAIRVRVIADAPETGELRAGITVRRKS